MTRYLKIPGLILGVAIMVGAVVTSATSAAEFKFKLDTSVALTGNQHGTSVDVFTTDAGTVACNEVTYSGELLGPETSEFELEPSYSGCTAFGFIGTPIHPNGCTYRFTTDTKEGSAFEGEVHFVCPGKPLEITVAFGCLVTVDGGQTPSGAVTYTGVGSGSTQEVTVDVNLTAIQYQEHDADEFPCTGDTELTSNGTYQGAALVTGEYSGEHIGVLAE